MQMITKMMGAAALTALLAGCSFSVGSPRNERVADAMKEAIENEGLEVVQISFEEDDDDRDLYHGEVRVKYPDSEEETDATCEVTINEEQLIESSDCPGVDGVIQARSLENTIVTFYQGRNIEVASIDMDWQENGNFTGYAEVPRPGTGEMIRLDCAGSPVSGGVDWTCNE
jgi:hypothetical protein